MNMKLEVIRLINNDVIATSCESVWGVARISCVDDDENIYTIKNGFKNGTNNTNRDEAGRRIDISPFVGAPKGYTTAGWYHVDASGTIIERCPYSGNESEDVYSHHHIDVSR